MAKDSPPSQPRAARLRVAAALAPVLALAAAVRLATWPWVFGGEEVRIVGDGDVLYHLLQAGRLLSDGLGAVWWDPGLDHPLGAAVPWPPLFDALLAGAGWLAAGGAPPDPATLQAAAAWVPALLGVAGVGLLPWLGRALLGGPPWLDAALVLALLPAHAGLTALGRADQHALEPLLLCLLLLAAARLARPPAGGPGWAGAVALLGAGAALAFWNWNGSALYLALLAGFAALLHGAAPAGDAAPGRTALGLAAGLGLGALLLAGSIAWLGPPAGLGAAGLSGLGGLQPAMVAGAGLACAALAAARRWRPAAGLPERLAAAGAALLLPPALLLALPWSGDGLRRGLAMLGASGWYRSIQEFRPLLPSGAATLAEDLHGLLSAHGLAPLAVAAALPLGWARWRRGRASAEGSPAGAAPGGAPALLFVAAAAGLLGLGWARNRFGPYLALAEALSVALLAREVAALAAARWPVRTLAGPAAGAALAALLVAPVLPGLPGAAWAVRSPSRYTDLAPLGRLAGQVPIEPGREAVMAPWNLGHDLRHWSGRPVVSSPFGVEGGVGALEADAAFHRAFEQADAEALLAARRAGLVVVSEPLAVVVSLAGLAPPGAAPVTAPDPDAARVDRVLDLPAFRRLVAARLWLWDGMWGDAAGRLVPVGLPALDAFRLLGEGATVTPWRAVQVPWAKLFQVVPGARVAVRARPGARVEAWVTLRTNHGREVAWTTHAGADAAGVARLRLPYATGLNGAVLATPFRLTDGRATADLPVPARAVLRGEPLEATLRP